MLDIFFPCLNFIYKHLSLRFMIYVYASELSQILFWSIFIYSSTAKPYNLLLKYKMIESLKDENKPCKSLFKLGLLGEIYFGLLKKTIFIFNAYNWLQSFVMVLQESS